MSKTRTTSADEAGDGDDARSPYVPAFADDAERDAFAADLLDEWKILHALGELRPAAPDQAPDDEDSGDAS